MQGLNSDAEEKSSALDYHLGHIDLQCVKEETDLRVIITSRLTWETQVLMVSAKANKLLLSGHMCQHRVL